ncbi:alpha/beta fold hydrolase [Kineosporia sp. A_224]|uniref:alpha/beta fold hydrolase n=1 Tax=Kineosporia sp. A_224 TaxID=1962180 RepID=UPI000B4BD8ED|nr:alpha/beta fold hydrolase [Kineosporia sp. A_224]
MDTFERDGLRFDVRDSGPRDGTGTVLLLHGFPQDGTAFDDVVPALHEAGLRTLVPDQRGYSPGARPSARSAYAMAETALDAVALLDAAGVRRAHVVGHDWGGATAWVLAARHAERLTSLTALSTPHPAAMAWAFTHSSQVARSWYMAFFQLPRLPERYAVRDLRRRLVDGGLPVDHATRYAERMQEPGAATGALNWYRGMPTSFRTPTPAVAVPTTYVWGRDDFALGRAAAERTRRHVVGPYRFVELDAGHWLPETCPEQVATVVLDQVRAVA